jgi:hypothetical protein
MSYIQLLNNLGFVSDPFAKTNADEEEMLEEYFIEPPFFKAVYGDTSTPKSSVVFAPRGGGKTALKRKIEISSLNENFLCITYNEFNEINHRLSDINLDFHLKNIIKLILTGILASIQELGITNLSKGERHLLYLFTKEYFSEIDITQLGTAIASVKNISDKTKEWWNTFSSPIGGLFLNTFLSNFGLNPVELKGFDEENFNLGGAVEQLKSLQKISQKLGYSCIYVLIDKIDENSLTGKASTSYVFIESFVKNLQVLELDKFAFKFFIWDLLKEFYQNDARPDRVKYYSLSWNTNQLLEMLSKRLKAYSNKTVNSFNEICESSGKDIDQIIVNFSQGSPRTIIRICKEIIDQQSELDSNSKFISIEAIKRGFENFSRDFATEAIKDERILKDLKKTKRTAFTIKYIYNDVFKFTQQAASSKIKTWQDTGSVEHIGSVQGTKKNSAVNLYVVKNLLVAKHIFAEYSIFEFVDKKIKYCPQCNNLLLRDWDLEANHICYNCE